MMWYEGGSWPAHYQIGLAVSTDGINWTKYNDAQTNEIPYADSDPVISFRSTWGDWDSVMDPVVIKSDDEFNMLYLGSDLVKQTIYYASSEDGIIWSKYADYPVFDQPPSWADVAFYDTGTLLESADGRTHFWYSCLGLDDNNSGWIGWQIGYAADVKDLPVVRSLELDRTFIRTDIDTLKIEAQVDNTIGHDISVHAKLYSNNATGSEYAQLYDDGEHNDSLAQDSFYGGYWVCKEEKTYNLFIEINDLSNGFTYNSLIPFNLKKQVTSIGPVQLPGQPYIDYYYEDEYKKQYIRLILHNKGALGTAVNLKVEINTSDPRIDRVVVGTRGFPDLAAGVNDTSSIFSLYEFIYADGYDPGNTIGNPIHFDVTIYSNDYPFWTDSFEFEKTMAGIADAQPNSIPNVFALSQNYPNPFNPKTVISYQLPVICNVELSIYNIPGQKVKKLVSKKQAAGTYKVEWDASGFASGIYLYQLKTDKGFIQTKKLVLLK